MFYLDICYPLTLSYLKGTETYWLLKVNEWMLKKKHVTKCSHKILTFKSDIVFWAWKIPLINFRSFLDCSFCWIKLCFFITFFMIACSQYHLTSKNPYFNPKHLKRYIRRFCHLKLENCYFLSSLSSPEFNQISNLF